MMMDDADAKEDNTFSDFTLAMPRKENLDDRPTDIKHSASNVLLDVLVYPIHRYGLITRTSSKGRTSGAIESIRNSYGGNSYEILMGRWPTFSNKITTITGLPAGCVGHDIHFTGFQGTDIIVLGKCSKPSYLPEIQIWLVSGYSRLIESRKKNESLQHKSMR